MKRYQRLLFGCLIFFALNHLIDWGPFNLLVVFAQSTTVTGQVKDANGLPYAGAQMKAQLVFAGTPVSNPTVQISNLAQCKANGFGFTPCNVPFSPNQGPFNLDNAGNLPGGGITLQDNSLVTPASTQWLFTVNSNGNPTPVGTGPQTCSATVTISGGSQNISSSLSACPVLSNVSNTNAGNQNAIYLSPSCPNPGSGNCFFTPANTQLAVNATFSAGSPNVATGANDPPFVAGDVGKRAEATACNASPNPEKCSVGCPDTTIATFTDNHHVVLAANCTGASTGTFSNEFSWGTPDDTGIAAAKAAMVARGRGLIALPCSGMWIEQAAFVFPTNIPGPMHVQACTGGADITIGFNFNYSGCFIGCFYDNRSIGDALAFPGTYWDGQDALSDVRLTALGNPALGTPPANLSWVLANQFQSFRNISIRGANWNTTNGFAAIMLCGGEIVGGGIQAGGDWAIRAPSGVTGCTNAYGKIASVYVNNGSRSAIKVEGTLVNQPVVVGPATWVFNDSANACSASNDNNPITLAGGTLFILPGSQVSTGSAPCQQSVNSVSYIDGLVSNGGGGNGSIAIVHGKSYIKNINFTQDNGLGVFLEASDAFVYDQGGWQFLTANPPQTLTGSIGNYYPYNSVRGSCTGVATASSTLGLYPMSGASGATTCTVTTPNVSPQVMDRAGNLFTLQVTATAGGVNASSGVVTVLKNGSATAVTCTLGTGTSCADFTHVVAFVAGDLISIQFTTQAADTLAGVKAVVAAE